MEKFTDQQLESLLNDIESDLVERKKSFKGDVPKKARQAICAFANDLPNHNKPGVLFIGAWDDGTPSNELITDELLRALADMKTDGNILPLPVLSVEKRFLKGSEMAVVSVMPSDMPPVKFEGRIWIRTGPRRSIANEQEERILLPTAFAADILENNGRTYEERLATCKMIVSPGNPTPTVLGLLSIGKSPQDFLPGAYIQFLRIDGTDVTRI